MIQPRLSNGFLKGMNSLIQAAKSRVRGCQTTRNLVTMLSRLGAQLNFSYSLETAKEPKNLILLE